MTNPFLLPSCLIGLLLGTTAAAPALGQVQRIWLTHRSNDPSRIVINWETATAGESVVSYGIGTAAGDSARTVRVEGSRTRHHVEIPLEKRDAIYHYTVATGQQRSTARTLKAYPTDTLRIAVVANWQARPRLDAVMKDDVHLLVTAGDNIDCLHRLCGPGVKDDPKPYAALVDAYPDLFASTPFLPALGNHDKEIRPRGPRPPEQAVYDVDATAFLKFFPLPDDGWKWRFDIPEFDLRLIALDLQHISDLGTTWQTCHPFHKGSAQFDWYEKLMDESRQSFVVTLQNERNSGMRSQTAGAWGRNFAKGSAVIAGFGYFAERAVVEGFPYYNTSLGGKGAKYPDPRGQFFASEDNYILMTLTRSPRKMVIEIKSLDGKVLDRSHCEPRTRP